MNRPLAAAIVAASISVCAPAQNEVLREEIRSRIHEMRNAIKEGVPVVTNVRVKVRLRNRHKIQGVVKQGRFIEKLSRLDFAPADTQTAGAGIRIWYYNKTNSYVFLPFEAIESYRIGERLTDEEVQRIEAEIEAERERSASARAQLLAERAAQVNAEQAPESSEKPPTGEHPAEGEEAAEAAGDAALLALLDEYPPTAGWGQDRMHEIQMRKITVGVYPDEKSRRFVEVFSDWQKAMQLKKQREAEEAPPPAPQPPAGK